MSTIALSSKSCSCGDRSLLDTVPFRILSDVMAPTRMSAVLIVPSAIFALVTA
jgi:hypothetical protein